MKGIALLGVVAALLLSVPQASAIVVIDFGTGDSGPGGTITITSTGITGTNISVDDLIVAGAIVNTPTTEVTGSSPDALDSGAGTLSFSCTGATQTDCSSTNTITITGGVPFYGIANGTVLLSGKFSPGSIIVTNNGVLGGVNATGPDTKSPLLLAAIGVPAGTQFEFFGFTVGFNTNGTGSPYLAHSTDMSNTEVVPEPTSILLLGTSLLGLGTLIRRRTNKA